MAEDEVVDAGFIIPDVLEEYRKTLPAGQQGAAPAEPENVWDAEDLQGVIEIPFDIGMLTTGFNGFALEDAEAQKLSKLFAKPLNRLAGNVKNADLIVALSALGAICVEKFMMYKLFLADKEKKRKRLEEQRKAAGESQPPTLDAADLIHANQTRM